MHGSGNEGKQINNTREITVAKAWGEERET